jgi:hypothetical protein
MQFCPEGEQCACETGILGIKNDNSMPGRIHPAGCDEGRILQPADAAVFQMTS